jgi:hypothetical protein
VIVHNLTVENEKEKRKIFSCKFQIFVDTRSEEAQEQVRKTFKLST